MSKSDLQWAGQLELVRRWIDFVSQNLTLNTEVKIVAQSLNQTWSRRIEHCISQRSEEIWHGTEKMRRNFSLFTATVRKQEGPSPLTQTDTLDSVPEMILKVLHLQKLIVREKGKNRKTSKEGDQRSGAICPCGKGQVNLYNYAPQLS